MVILRKLGDALLVFTQDLILKQETPDSVVESVQVPDPPAQPNLAKGLKEVLVPENRTITSVCAAADGAFLAVTLQNRQVVVYNSNFGVVANFLSKRAASRVQFARDNSILVADKTGDVYLYKMAGEEQPLLLLGHLSMLLDLTMSVCGRYVITSDRDEKIRVSCYPNCYNIVSYCLGHSEFVSNLCVCGDILISAAGDGVICFWEFLHGRRLFQVNTNDYLEDKSELDRFRKDMDVENVTITAIPITDMQVYNGFVAATVLGFNGIQLYCFDRTGVKFLRNLKLQSGAIAFNLGAELVVLTEKSLDIYRYSADDFDEVNSITKLYAACENILPRYDSVNSRMVALYKRKFDNVQEYLERKRLRLKNK